MSLFAQTLFEFEGYLRLGGYRLAPVICETAPGTPPVQVVFPRPVISGTVIAIPDVHLSDGSSGDIFCSGFRDKSKRLCALLQATYDYQIKHPKSSYAVQLGDWFDLWRTCGGDPRCAQFGDIQNAAVHSPILDLDAKLGLAHVIGNHDATFLYALPDRRASQPHLFRYGFWLGKNVYALHGHQTDLLPHENPWEDSFFVGLASVLANVIPGVCSLEACIDRLGTSDGFGQWAKSAFGQIRQDPGPSPRPLASKTPADIKGPFVERERAEVLTRLVDKVAGHSTAGHRAEIILVGHSHNPCVAWTDVLGRPVVLVDAGAWVYEQANVLIGADDTIGVFSIIPV